jgi:polyferredoxin
MVLRYIRMRNRLIDDIIIIIISVVVAITLVKTGLIIKFLNLTHGFWFIDSFLAGLFFTSAFTTAPAIATLGGIAQYNSVISVAIFGGLGALCGDLIIFRFMRDRLSEDFIYLLKQQSKKERITSIFKLKFFRWFTFFLGALIIASPLPDELGIMMMGFSKTKISLFIPVSFIFNSIGILIIGLIVRAII